MAEHVHYHHHPHPHSAPVDAHIHEYGGDFVAANREYFDKHAHQLEEMHPLWREMSRKQVEAMRSEWPSLFDKEHTVTLDFACGIGLVSENLQQYVKSVVGVDISQISVDRYNALASKLGLSPEVMKGVCTELKGEAGELDGVKFDLIVCCASYHHFPSIDDITRLLVSFLKPGGALLVADIKAEDDHSEIFPESHKGLVPHKHGLTEEQLRTTFEGAGLGGFEAKEMERVRMEIIGRDVLWFIARGVKPL